MLRHVLPMLLVAGSQSLIAADSYLPWRDQRVVSDKGEYYVVMKRIGGPRVYGEWGPVEFVIAQRRPGSAPVKAAACKVDRQDIEFFDSDKGGDLYEIQPNSEVAVRDGDRVLGRGKLDRAPLEVLVSDTGLGFACLDVWGHNNWAGDTGHKNRDAVIVVSSTGEILHKLRMADLFTKVKLDGFDGSINRIWWLHLENPGWINEAGKQIVIVAEASEQLPDRHSVRFVDWESGRVESGPTQASEADIKALRRKHAGRDR